MDFYRVVLFVCIVNGCYGHSYVNVTQTGCIYFDLGRDLQNPIIIIVKDMIAVLISLGADNSFITSGNLTGRITNYNINRPEGTISFCIVNTTIFDGGVYSVDQTNTAILYVLDLPSRPVISVLKNGTVGSDNGMFSCLSVSTSIPYGLPLIYTWFVNNTKLKNETQYRCYRKDTCNELIIIVDQNDKFNDYTCFATEQYGQSSEFSGVVKINPKYQPIVSVSPNNNPFRVAENTANLLLTCIVTDANPAVTSFTWEKDDSTISRTALYTIPTVYRSHAGSYTCSASNSVGNSKPSTAIKLEVLYGIEVVAVSKTEPLEGTRLTVTCSGQSYPAMTDDDVTWTKQNNNTFTMMGKQLVINTVNRVDSGNYVCSVVIKLLPSVGPPVNVTGMTTVVVDVLFKPLLDHTRSYSPPYVSAAKNSSLHLQLTINSNPTPTIEWKFRTQADWDSCNFIKIVSNTTTNSFFTSSSILIDDVQSDIFGEYTFSANNTVGTFFRRFVVMKEANLAQVKCPITNENTGMFLAGIVTLIVGLMSLTAAVIFVSRNGLKNKALNSSKCVEYSDMQRSNPAFTDAYTTLQPNIESTVTSEQNINNYEECGRTPEAHTYSSVDKKEAELSQYQQHGVNTYEECGKGIDAHAYDTLDK